MKQKVNIYKALRNTIVKGKEQIAVILPSNCTMKDAKEFAIILATQLNSLEEVTIEDKKGRRNSFK
jgi:hypothetical protein